MAADQSINRLACSGFGKKYNVEFTVGARYKTNLVRRRSWCLRNLLLGQSFIWQTLRIANGGSKQETNYRHLEMILKGSSPARSWTDTGGAGRKTKRARSRLVPSRCHTTAPATTAAPAAPSHTRRPIKKTLSRSMGVDLAEFASRSYCSFRQSWRKARART